MADTVTKALRGLIEPVLRAASPAELVLMDANIAAAAKGRQPRSAAIGGPQGFGGAEGFVFLLPPLLFLIGEFSKGSLAELGKLYGAHIAGLITGNDKPVAVDAAALAETATTFAAALEKRGVSPEKSRGAADVLVRTLLENPKLIRDLRGK
ncbi:MAG TPA: hypothetical protein VE974_04830 [Thermoanaerobaculia bacterium]|nr:hypothetical protein [Thermoanaerobaculia bacterium]